MLKNRLTRWSRGKWVLPRGKGAWRKITERLAAYEDSGVEPENLSKTLYSKTGTVNGSLTVTLTEEERFAIINALSRAAWNKEDDAYHNDRFLDICQLLCKIGGHDITKEQQ